MLTLTRREGESLLIELKEAVDPATPIENLLGAGLMLHTQKIRSGQVRVSVDADPGLAIRRAEISLGDNEVV